MNVRHTLIFFFFLSLRAGNTGLISIRTPIITGEEGGKITHACHIYYTGTRRIFTREGKDVLIDTTEDRYENGRYSIEYTEGSSTRLYVSITNLTKSDSGSYTCGYARDSTVLFFLTVNEAPVTLKPKPTPRPFSTSVPSASTLKTMMMTTAQSLSSSSGSSSPSSASTETPDQSQQQQTVEAPGVVLSVRLTLVIMFIVSSAAVLIFCRKRISKPAEACVEAEYVNVTEVIQMSEIREEDRRSRPPPAEISTV